jgi:prolyl-tRNA editing enzyme YbaK/EbsC (Cys-tRNA(Pro) deacylase)
MWPEPVERIAVFLRESSAHGRIEELPPGVDTPPGTGVRAEAFDCDGRRLVVLAPDDATVDRERLRRRAGCTDLHESAVHGFPFQGARVLLDRSLLSGRTLWLQAGTPRHVLGLSPTQLVRLTHAETGRFLVQD